MPKSWVRKELKKEPLSNVISRVLPWVLAHRETALSLLATSAVVVGVAAYLIHHLTRMEQRAWERLSFAQAHQQRDLQSQAASFYDEILRTYPRTRAATYAFFYKAESLYQQKKYQEAAQIYQDFVQNHRRKKFLLPLAYFGLGMSLEAEAKFPEAINTYRTFLDTFPEHFLTPTVYLSLERCYQLNGQENEAASTLEKIITLYPGSNWQRIAETHLNILK